MLDPKETSSLGCKAGSAGAPHINLKKASAQWQRVSGTNFSCSFTRVPWLSPWGSTSPFPGGKSKDEGKEM